MPHMPALNNPEAIDVRALRDRVDVLEAVDHTTYVDGATIQGDGTVGDPLTVVGGGTVQTDGVHVDGDGSGGSPIVIIKNTRDLIDVKKTYSADVTGVNDSTTAVRNAITAAAANVASTGRRTTLYFEPGEYSFRTKDAIRILDLAAKTKLVFEGVPGRTRFLQNGSAAGGDWHLFQIQTSASDIEFRHIIMDQAGLTNPDPAEQNHLVELGNGATNVRFYDCEFTNTIGDGIRIRGEFGASTQQIDIQRCLFPDCGRSGIGFQRWVRNVTINGCTFTGGTDQQVDYEPTGYQLTASAGGGTTTLIRTGSSFQTWGIVAGMVIYNVNDGVFGEVVSVDSQTQITTTTMPSSWSGAVFSFPQHLNGHIITNNQFLRSGVLNADILVTLSGAMGTVFANNYVEGCIQFEHTKDLEITGNRLFTRKSADSAPAIQSIKTCHGLLVADNRIWCRRDAVANNRLGISITDQSGAYPADAIVARNRIFADTRTVGINVESIGRVSILDNHLVLNTPGDTGSGAINVRATSRAITHAEVTGNIISKMSSASGSWSYGIQFSVNAHNIGSIVMGGGHISGATNPTNFGTGAGAYQSPPIVLGLGVGEGASPLVPNASVPWFMVGGVGGQSAASQYKPGIFWGDGSPEGVLSAPVGSIAQRRDGSAGTVSYVKLSGTGNTGWAPVGGVAATGTITCVAKASMADTDYVTIGDGYAAPRLYEFDTAGDGVTAGRIQVNISGSTTASDVALVLKTAIETNQPSIAVSEASGVLTLTHKMAGTLGNVTITENVADAGFLVTGMTGGVNAAR